MLSMNDKSPADALGEGFPTGRCLRQQGVLPADLAPNIEM